MKTNRSLVSRQQTLRFSGDSTPTPPKRQSFSASLAHEFVNPSQSKDSTQSAKLGDGVLGAVDEYINKPPSQNPQTAITKTHSLIDRITAFFKCIYNALKKFLQKIR